MTTPETTTERVAAAICGEDSWSASSDSQKEMFLSQARDAIKAIREPSKAMIFAAHAIEETAHKSYAELTKARFSAMIDAALDEGIG